MRDVPVFLLILLFLGAGLCSGQPAPEVGNPVLPATGELESDLTALVEGGDFTAIGVALAVRGSEPVFVCLSSPGADPVNPDTRFDVGAVSQSLLAVSLMRLSVGGRPLIDARVGAVLPDLPFENPWEASEPLRVEHLLEHTAGFQDLPMSEYARSGRSSDSIRETLERHPTSLVCLNRPGRFSVPVSTGPMVAVLAAEEVAGQPFESWLRKSVFEPLQISAEYRRPAGESGGASVGSNLWPVLGLEASVRDLSALVQMLLERGRVGGLEYLRESEVQRLETPATADAFRNGLQVGFGLGMRTFPDNGFVFYGTQSGLDADLAAFRYLPQHGLGFAVLAKGAGAADFRALVIRLNRFCTSRLEPPQPLFVDFPANRLAAVDGYYRPLTFRWAWTGFFLRLVDVEYIQHLQGRLLVESPAGSEAQLFPVTDRRFRAEGEPLPTVVFSRGEDGHTVVEGFSEHFQGNFERASGGLIWLERVGGVVSLGVLAIWLVLALFLTAVGSARGNLVRRDFLLLLVPSLAAISLAAVVIPLAIAQGDLVSEFGRLTWASGTLFVGSLLCPPCTALAVGTVLFQWRSHRSRNVWIFSAAVSLAAALVATYLLYWGVFGLRTWV